MVDPLDPPLDTNRSTCPTVGGMFVHVPRPICHTQFRSGNAGAVPVRSAAPSANRDMIHRQMALRHHLFQVSEAEPKPQTPADTQKDDLSFKMSSFEECWPVPAHESKASQT